MVLKLGLEARQTDDPVDYRRYYQQWSDICMLRLFDSFMESGPQLVFQLVVIITKSDWTTFNVTWTGISVIASTISLGWGVAAYSQALRLVREDKGEMSWFGMVLQTLWRFFMLSARIVALVLLCLALEHWALIVICKFNLSKCPLSSQRIFSLINIHSRCSCPLVPNDRLGDLAKY